MTYGPSIASIWQICIIWYNIIITQIVYEEVEKYMCGDTSLTLFAEVFDNKSSYRYEICQIQGQMSLLLAEIDPQIWGSNIFISHNRIENFTYLQRNLPILTNWSRVMHICISKLAIIDSDNGLLPGRRQTIIWINAGILLNGSLGTNFSEIFIKILTFSYKKMHLKISSVKWRLFCLGLNVLNNCGLGMSYAIIDHGLHRVK